MIEPNDVRQELPQKVELEPDALFLYFGDEYRINDQIVVKQPTIGQVADFGEASYFSMVHTISAVSSDMKANLWDIGLDWCEVDDFDLFILLSQGLTPDKTNILFGDLDFSKMRPFQNPQNDEIVLADKETGVIIDKLIYTRMVNYIRKLHNITPKVEKTKSKTVKKWLIEEDRRRLELAKDKPFKSYLLPLISAIKVKQGYTKEYVRNMGLYEFFDDINRANVIDHSFHLLNGAYCGMADLKKVPKQEFNWMRELL
jgi:hypothetical protein